MGRAPGQLRCDIPGLGSRDAQSGLGRQGQRTLAVDPGVGAQGDCGPGRFQLSRRQRAITSNNCLCGPGLGRRTAATSDEWNEGKSRDKRVDGA